MLDLCCGSHGASAAMRAAGWSVVSVDIRGDVLPSIVADVRALPLPPLMLDLLWASPPCEEFSRLRLPFASCRRLRPQAPDLSVARAVREVIDLFRPKVWVVECVWAARSYLSPLFGEPVAISPGHMLWSNRLILLPQLRSHKDATRRHMAAGRRRHLALSRVPFAVSQAVEVVAGRAGVHT